MINDKGLGKTVTNDNDPLLREDDEEKVCRICLGDDLPHELIAPCRCRGYSKWVHRNCLDQWRATNPENLAFSRCGECLFDYHIEAVRGNGLHRRAKYCLYVSRDICLATIVVQGVIGLFALLVWIVGEGQALTNDMNCQDDTFCVTGTYYTIGMFLALVALGIYGLILLCTHRCSIDRAMDAAVEHSSISSPRQEHPQTTSPPLVTRIENRSLSSTDGTGGHGLRSALDRPSYPRSMRGRSSSRDADCCNGCNFCCVTCSDCDGCDCVCCTGGCTHGAASSGNGGGSDGAPVLLIIVAIVAIVLALIGLFVGVFIASVVLQRILQRHMFLLHKQRLTKDFRVRDLSDEMVEDDLEGADCPFLLPPPKLEPEQASHLQKLGLIN